MRLELVTTEHVKSAISENSRVPLPIPNYTTMLFNNNPVTSAKTCAQAQRLMINKLEGQ
jgi:hypothetical protein